MTIKPSLKSIMDRMEERGADGKDKVIFASATDMDANRIETGDNREGVVRRPRQVWDISLLLYESKPRIRTLGTSLVQKETLKYQVRNEINCAQKLDADEFQAELMGPTSVRVAKFLQTVVKHDVRLPAPETKAETPGLPNQNPNPNPDPMGMGIGQEQPPPEKKVQEPEVSRIVVKQQGARVDFVLDLMLDNLALMQIQAVASLSASAMRAQMEVMANLSLRHALAKAGRDLGDKGLSERQVPPGTFPPGAFPRTSDGRNVILRTDREPLNRVSWMAGLLPYMGQQPLYNKIDFQKSWRDSNNWLAGNTVVPQFLDPTYPDHTRFVSLAEVPLDFAATHYVGMAGVGLDAAGYKRGDPGTAHKRGVFSYDGSASVDEIRKGRGLGNTIMAIQLPHDPATGTGVSPWIAGGGATLRGVPETKSVAPFVLTTDRNGKPISHQNKRGTYAVMTDGSVRFIDQYVSDEVFKAMCTVNGPTPADFDLNKNPATPLIKAPGAKDPEPKQKTDKSPPPPTETKKQENQSPTVAETTSALQGEWIPKLMEKNGQIAPAEFIKNVRMIFQKDQAIFRDLSGKQKDDPATFTLDASKIPMRIEFLSVADKKPSVGIFEISQDELRICLRSEKSDKGIPTAFATAPNSDLVLFVLTRKK